MSDLEEGEIEDGELPSEQLRVGSSVLYAGVAQESSFTGLWVWSKRVPRSRSREGLSSSVCGCRLPKIFLQKR